jgi:hypothetical protein
VKVKCIDSRRGSSYGTGNSAFQDASEFAENLLEITFTGLDVVDLNGENEQHGYICSDVRIYYTNGVGGDGRVGLGTHIEGNIADEKLCAGIVFSVYYPEEEKLVSIFERVSSIGGII